MNKWLSLFIILIILCAIVDVKAEDEEMIKLGTLATETSDWGKIFKQMNAELMEKSDSKLLFRIYFGRDEKDLADLIKSKQFDAVSASVLGLGQVLPEILVFYLPMLFSTYEELDYVRNGLTEYYAQQFDRKGYKLLGWGDMGFGYLFSKEPVRTQTDLQKTQLWVWDIDPISKAYASASGREPVVLPIQNVLSSLIRGDIQTVYGPPLACIVFQWHTQIKYMTDLRLAVGIGATIMSKSRFDKLSDRHKGLIQEISRRHHERLVKRIRARNEESIDVLKQQGIQIISVPHQERLKWAQIARRVENQFAGQLYSKELLDEVKNLLEAYHKHKR